MKKGLLLLGFMSLILSVPGCINDEADKSIDLTANFTFRYADMEKSIDDAEVLLFDKEGFYVGRLSDEAVGRLNDYTASMSVHAGVYTVFTFMNKAGDYCLYPTDLLPGKTRYNDLEVRKQSVGKDTGSMLFGYIQNAKWVDEVDCLNVPILLTNRGQGKVCVDFKIVPWTVVEIDVDL